MDHSLVNQTKFIRQTAFVHQMVALALLFGPWAGCTGPESSLCGEGLLCPSSYRCFDDGATFSCVKGTCGDGIIDPDEVCDDGNKASGDGCRGDCMSNEECGNGVIDHREGENCDDSNIEAGDGCDSDCWGEGICGNGALEPESGEVCDDGDTEAGPGCSADCRSDQPCGDGLVDTEIGEECDDGNTVSWDGCTDCLTDGLLDCSSAWLDDKPYQFCPGLNWPQARSICSGRGYHLVKIDDAREDAFITEYANKYSIGSWWLGLSDLGEERTYVWLDGSLPAHTNWAENQPYHRHDYDCGLAAGANGQWSIARCGSVRAFVCESAMTSR